MKKLLLISLSFLLPFLNASEPSTLSMDSLLHLEIKGSINPAVYNYLKSALERAKEEGHNGILITMDTPGGLVSTTKDILTAIGESDVPIIVWVKPEGASATSAGALISAGAHLLYMASGTNMGAAAPVMMGKDIDPGKIPNPNSQNEKEKQDPLAGASDMKKKAVNDLVALVKSLSEARGRNGEKFGEMVSKASSFTSSEALEEKIIDGIANTYQEIYGLMDGATIKLKGKEFTLQTQKPNLVQHIMDWGQTLFNIFANPSFAYILFLAGAALIYLEMQAPGGFVAGAIGAICLILAALGFQVLPLNGGALGLIVLSFALFILEIYVTSFGLLTLAGVVSLVFGSLFLFRGSGGHVELPMPLIFSVAGAIGVFTFLIAVFWAKDARKKNIDASGLYSMKGKTGRITSVKTNGHFSVKISGEIWEAESSEKLQDGDQVTVQEHNQDTMLLKVTASQEEPHV